MSTHPGYSELSAHLSAAGAAVMDGVFEQHGAPDPDNLAAMVIDAERGRSAYVAIETRLGAAWYTLGRLPEDLIVELMREGADWSPPIVVSLASGKIADYQLRAHITSWRAAA